jgi:hypothetical protein
MAFPTSTASPHHHGGHQGAVQSPPKRVDELMSELADFDPSIQVSIFEISASASNFLDKYSS